MGYATKYDINVTGVIVNRIFYSIPSPIVFITSDGMKSKIGSFSLVIVFFMQRKWLQGVAAARVECSDRNTRAAHASIRVMDREKPWVRRWLVSTSTQVRQAVNFYLVFPNSNFFKFGPLLSTAEPLEQLSLTIQKLEIPQTLIFR